MKNRLQILLFLLLGLGLFSKPIVIINDNLSANNVTAFGTLAAVIIALAIAVWGERFKKWGGYKPDIVILRSLENIQENNNGDRQGQTRLIFKNRGELTAEDVEVYVNMIYDNNVPRNNFIAVPLSWTHDGRSKRNFHPSQFGYLDLCRIDNIDTTNITPNLVLSAGAGIPTYEDIRQGDTRMELIIFQKAGKTEKYAINLQWQMGEDLVRVTRIRNLNG